jgi:transposase
MKRDGRGLDHKTLENLRKLAVRRVVEDGEKPSAIIASLGLSRTSIYPWLRKFHHGGWEALSERIAKGPKPKLTEQQCQQVKQWIAGNDPRQYGFESGLWTRRIVQTMVREKFGIKLCLPSIGKMLAQLELTPQKPLRRAYERDSKAIRQWMENTFPKLLERAHKRQASIVCIDESGFMLAPLLRRTWAPRGHTPVIKIVEPHERISVIGAISISPVRQRFGFHFHLLEDNANFRGASLVRFIKEVRSKMRGPITLLWDKIPIHRSKPVMDHLGKHRTIVVEPFPPYAPELNPVDNVWSYVKWGRLPNYAPPDLIELRNRLTKEFRRLEKRPDLLKAFFTRTALPLDPVARSSDSAQPSTALSITLRACRR